MNARRPRRPRTKEERRRRLRIRIAIEVTVGAAAIWVVSHPRFLPERTYDAPVPVSAAENSDVAPTRDSTAALPGDGAVSTPIPTALEPLTRVAPVLVSPTRLLRSTAERARAGERITVSLTAYCLQGRTRSGTPVREGIIAVDRTLFPLGRTVEIGIGRKTPVRYRAEDTGGAIRGARIDIWVADCSEARRFGRRRGWARIVPAGTPKPG